MASYAADTVSTSRPVVGDSFSSGDPDCGVNDSVIVGKDISEDISAADNEEDQLCNNHLLNVCSSVSASSCCNDPMSSQGIGGKSCVCVLRIMIRLHVLSVSRHCHPLMTLFATRQTLRGRRIILKAAERSLPARIPRLVHLSGRHGTALPKRLSSYGTKGRMI